MNPSKLRVVPSCVLLSLLVLRRTQKPHTAIFIGRCFFLHLRLVARDFLNRHVTPRRKKKLLQPNHPPCRRRATQKKKRCLVHIPPVVVFDRLQRHAFKMLRALGRYLSITLKISLFFFFLFILTRYIFIEVYTRSYLQVSCHHICTSDVTSSAFSLRFDRDCRWKADEAETHTK